MRKATYLEEINDLHNKSKHYFAAANTEDGFVSFFDSVFNNVNISKIYILKGGPGVGKSTIMKKAAIIAEKKGLTVENYHCSSDPKSLDGVVIKEKKIVILDGTSPHVFDPVYPGARDVIINLGEAWDLNKLEQNFLPIKELSREKSASYKTAYRILHAAGIFDKELTDIGMSCFKYDKAYAAAKRLAEKLAQKEKVQSVCDFTVNNAISCDGKVRFFTHEKDAETLYFVKDVRNLSGVFFDMLEECLKKSGEYIVCGKNPLSPEKTDDIYLPDSKTIISRYDTEFCSLLEKNGVQYKVINLGRFVDAEKYRQQKTKYRFTERCFETLMNEAFFYLAKAGEYHAELEKIYSSATDYEKVAFLAEPIFKEI